MRPASYRQRLVRAFVAIGTVPVALLGALAAWYDYETRLGEIQARLQQEAAGIAATAAAIVTEHARELETLTRLQTQDLLDPKQRELPLRLLVADRAAYRQVLLVDSTGHQLVAVSNEHWTDPAESGDFSQDPVFRSVVASRRPDLGEIRFDPANGEPLIVAAVPVVRPETGELAGVLSAEIRMRPLWDMVSKRQSAPGEDAYIVDGDGRIVAHRNPSKVLGGLAAPAADDGAVWQRGADGGAVLAARQSVELGTLRLAAVVEQTRSQALRPLTLGLAAVALLTLASLAAALLLFAMAVRRIVDPVNAVAAAARAVRDGDLSATAPVQSDDEIGELAHAFNTMAERVRYSMEEAAAEIADHRRTQVQLVRLNRAHQSLSRCSQLTLRATEETPLLEEVCRIIAEECGYPLVWVATEEESGSIAVAASAGWQAGSPANPAVGRLASEADCWPAGAAIRTFSPLVCGSVDHDDAHPACRDEALSRGFSACAAIPFRVGAGRAGAICIYAAETDAFAPEELRLLGEVAGAVGFGLSALRLRAERDETQAQLRQARDSFELLLRSAAEGIFGLDRDGRTIFVNQAASALTGWSEAELMGSPHHALLHHHRADGTPFPHEQCPVLGCMESGEPRTVDGEVFWRKDGGSLPVQYTCAPVVLDGRITGSVVVFHDISARKRMEEEVARSNAELTQFAYAVSHDLQEPLRMVSSFLTLLDRGYGTQLPAEAREFIAYAVDGSRRMSDMIAALLDYSRIHTNGRPLEPVDMNVALEEAKANLTVAIAEAGAEIVSAPLPQVSADRNQMVRLLQNLIGNAVKYRRAGIPPAIRIAAELSEGEWHFTVGDNGIGVAPADYERIFGLFQRLHQRGEYEGNGVGLALCKRIVHRHGGHIWVTSTLGEGSTFHFTLPGTHGPGMHGPSTHDIHAAVPDDLARPTG